MLLKKVSFILSILFLFFASSSFAGSVSYQYDELNRLIRAEYSDGTVIEYTYDAAGNRLRKEVKLENVCEGDFDHDGDVDGSDLATFAAGGTGITLENFAADFGRTDCPH